jgi:hypothetical protein
MLPVPEGVYVEEAVARGLPVGLALTVEDRLWLIVGLLVLERDCAEVQVIAPLHVRN